MQNKKPFEIILHVERVTSLQSWVAKKSCHSQTLINECFIFDYPSKSILQDFCLCGTEQIKAVTSCSTHKIDQQESLSGLH